MSSINQSVIIYSPYETFQNNIKSQETYLFFSEYMHFRTKTIALTVTLTITITFPLKISTYLILIKTISSCYHVILTTQFTNKWTFQTDFF